MDGGLKVLLILRAEIVGEEDPRAGRKAGEETGKQMRETDRRLSRFGNRLGEVIEYTIAPNLRQKFKDLGLNFPRANLNTDVSDYDNDIFLEIDIFLENGEKALLVEVKTKPSVEDVQDHIERIEKMRLYANLHGDRRTFLGAMGGVVMADDIKKFILKQGMFLIEPSGETFTITPPNGQPKEW